MNVRTRLAVHLATVVAVVAVPMGATPAWAAGQNHTIAAFFIDYMPPNSLAINEGDTVTFVNTDPFGGEGHSFTQATSGSPPRFGTDVIPFGSSSDVRGVSAMPPGQYLVQCEVHPIMRLHLFVGPPRRAPVDRLADILF